MRLIIILFLGLTAILAYEDVSSEGGAESTKQAAPVAVTAVPQAPVEPVIRPGLQPMRMVASWYGEPFHGRKTANGEIYDMYKISAAHRYFPFGTRLRVTNPKNHRSLIVEINDRGPYIEGRDLDLSFMAACELDFDWYGVVPLTCQLVYWPQIQKPGAS